MRLFGYALLGLAALALIAHWVFGLHLIANDIAHYFFGPYATQTFGSPVGEGIIYLVIYFIAVLGLAVVARTRGT